MRTAIIILDMQNAYFEDPVQAEQLDDVRAACNRLVAAARASDAPVFMPVTEHEKDKSTWTLNMREDDQGFAFRGTEQAELVPGLDSEGAYRIVKTRDSAFHGTDLVQRLTRLGVDRLVLAGVSAKDCVARTGTDAFANDFHVVYAHEAIGSTDPELGRQTLEKQSREYRQGILDLDAIEELLRTSR